MITNFSLKEQLPTVSWAPCLFSLVLLLYGRVQQGRFSLLRIIGILLPQLVKYKPQNPASCSNIFVSYTATRVILLNKNPTTQLLFSRPTHGFQLHLNGTPALPKPDKSLSPPCSRYFAILCLPYFRIFALSQPFPEHSLHG